MQVTAYANDVLASLAADVTSFVVVPEGVLLSSLASEPSPVGSVGLCDSSAVSDAFTAWLTQ
jgi:hypothetical protein